MPPSIIRKAPLIQAGPFDNIGLLRGAGFIVWRRDPTPQKGLLIVTLWRMYATIGKAT